MIHKFELGGQVTITCSQESGEIVGRAEYPTFLQYLVRYVNGSGIANEGWWNEEAIEMSLLEGDEPAP
jgi:hypothetical protein